MISTLERLEAYEQAEREYMYTEGRVKGRTEGRVEVAKNMLVDGLKPDVIAKYTGLSLVEIQSLK